MCVAGLVVVVFIFGYVPDSEKLGYQTDDSGFKQVDNDVSPLDDDSNSVTVIRMTLATTAHHVDQGSLKMSFRVEGFDGFIFHGLSVFEVLKVFLVLERSSLDVRTRRIRAVFVHGNFLEANLEEMVILVGDDRRPLTIFVHRVRVRENGYAVICHRGVFVVDTHRNSMDASTNLTVKKTVSVQNLTD